MTVIGILRADRPDVRLVYFHTLRAIDFQVVTVNGFGLDLFHTQMSYRATSTVGAYGLHLISLLAHFLLLPIIL
jgi:hypothetical protein